MTRPDVLSHDEIAALVAAAREGSPTEGIPDRRRRRTRRVREIDFSRPSKFTQDQHRRLERAHESFCRRASTKLSAELRTSLEVALINSSQLTWSAALAEIPQGALLGVLRVEPLGTRLLLSAELDFVIRMIDLVLGGAGTAKTVRRELTDIETALSRRLFEMIVDPLSLAWQELADLTLTPLEIGPQARNAQLAPLSEPAVSLTFEVRLAQTSSTLALVIPHRSVQSVLGQIGTHRYDGDADEGDRAAAATLMTRALEAIDVELRAEVGSVELSLAELLALEPGAVIPLPSAGRSAALFLEETRLHRIRLGQADGRRAVQILDGPGEQP